MERALRAMADAMERGAPLHEAISMLAPELDAVAARMREGATPADALAGRLEPDELAQIGAACTPGVLRAIAARRELAARVRRAIRLALAPVALCTFMLAIILGISAYVAGLFERMYADIGIMLPAPTMLIVKLSAYDPFWVAATAIVSVAFLFVGVRHLLRLTSAGAVEFLVPLWGRIARNRDLAAYCTTLSAAMDAGVPFSEAGRAATRAVRNGSLRAAFERVQDRAIAGVDPNVALAEERVLPSTFRWAVALSRKRGDLPDTLRMFADIYGEEMESGAEILSRLASPLGVLIMINILLFTIGALLMPMFMLVSGIGGF